MATVFVSYTRRSGDVVKTLVNDLEALGHTVWFDQELSGGHAWWSQILQRIRDCDVFAFVLDPESLDSTACQRESGYAADLGKRILPILVSGDVSVNLLPPALSQIQFVDYLAKDRDAVLHLARALGSLPPSLPLPDPLPPPPAAPISYLGNLTSQVETASTLSYEQQSALLVDLRRHLRDASTADDARRLLEKLRKRRDLLATIAEEIAELNASPAKQPPRAVDQSQALPHPRGVVAAAPAPRVKPQVTEPPGEEARAPGPELTAVSQSRVPDRRERQRTAVIGMIVGALIGAAAMTTARDFDGTALLFGGLITGAGVAIAGAITGSRLRLVALALAGAIIVWILLTAMTVVDDSFAFGAVFGVPTGAVLGAILGAMLRKRVAWLDSPS